MHTSLPAAALVAVDVFDVLLCARVVFFRVRARLFVFFMVIVGPKPFAPYAAIA